jgi:hypothetical protein
MSIQGCIAINTIASINDDDDDDDVYSIELQHVGYIHMDQPKWHKYKTKSK